MTARLTSFTGMSHLIQPIILKINGSCPHQNIKEQPLSKGSNSMPRPYRLCPVAALAAYITIRDSKEGPFFLSKTEAHLTRERFVKLQNWSCYYGIHIQHWRFSYTNFGSVEKCSVSTLFMSSSRTITKLEYILAKSLCHVISISWY